MFIMELEDGNIFTFHIIEHQLTLDEDNNTYYSIHLACLDFENILFHIFGPVEDYKLTYMSVQITRHNDSITFDYRDGDLSELFFEDIGYYLFVQFQNFLDNMLRRATYGEN